jgi:phage terminase large subunit-like protein
MLKSKEQYIELIKELGNLKEGERNEVIRHLCKTDIYFLSFFVLDQEFYYNDFAFDFCRKISENPWQLWLVARGHLKSLTITVAHNIQLILNNPDIAIAIPSYNMKTAKSFVRQIKIILESNALLKDLFPEILYANPSTQSPKWSEQEGLVIKRKTTRKEPTVMGFGLVDGQATGYHFDVLSFDDVVTQDSVTSPEMIQKTTERWQLSDNIGMPSTLKKYCGTRYHYFDTYAEVQKVTPTTIIPATDNGEIDGNPVFLTREELDKKLADQGRYIFSAQMLLKPVAREDQKFRMEDFRYYDELPRVNYYIAVDPANTQSKKSDYTAMLVFGFSEDRKVYLVDGVHDKLDLGQRYRTLKALNERYKPLIIGYERYGLQADIDFFRMENAKTNYYMPITEVGGTVSKEDRILRLQALFETKDLIFPKHLRYTQLWNGEQVDIVNSIQMELLAFPFAEHDDLSDCLSRCYDIFLDKPNTVRQVVTERDTQTAGYRFEQLKNKYTRGKDNGY